jgi:hypothetical protein
MALTYGREDSKIHGWARGRREEIVGDVNEKAEELQRFKKAAERVTDCQGKNNIRQETESVQIPDTRESMGQAASHAEKMIGLEPPRLDKCDRPMIGDDVKQLRKENKRRKRERKAVQQQYNQWKVQKGEGKLRKRWDDDVKAYQNAMCPQGQALRHPAAQLLQEYAEFGCPVRTGKPWTKEMMEEAVQRGPHQSALTPEALEHFAAEAKEKVEKGQAILIPWDETKDNPPPELKISPVAAIPHKSKAFRTILDLSYRIRLKNGGVISSVNDMMEKLAPQGSIDQIGESLTRIIYAFAEADEDAKIFMPSGTSKTVSGGWGVRKVKSITLHTSYHSHRDTLLF